MILEKKTMLNLNYDMNNESKIAGKLGGTKRYIETVTTLHVKMAFSKFPEQK